jgi:dephospho-CoA kinase
MNQKDHLIIGLTGNIGSGKSSVLNMLRHLGAYGIDADALARKAFEQEDTAAKIKDRFGNLDRKTMALRVFNDEQALADLESIIHPQVTRMADMLIANSALPVIVIEAIKLLESDLAALCDQIWVVAADEAQVIERLTKGRGMDRLQIMQRLANQSPVSEKADKADVIIHNNHTRENTWKQTEIAWHALQNLEKYKAFMTQTHTLYTPILSHIVQPFSPAHARMRAMITDGKNMRCMPGSCFLNTEKLDNWICDEFILTMEDASAATNFSFWRLSTFEFVMRAVIEPEQETQVGLPIFSPPLAEQFALTHRVESLTIVIPFPFKESNKKALKDQGFIAADEKLAENAQWRKAGYNVLKKQIWNLLADLEDIRPI